MARKNRLLDLPLLGVSLFIAFVIWLMAEQGQLTTDQLSVPVELINVPENVEVEQEPDRLPIIVNFPQSLRSRVVSQNFAVRLDVAEELGDDPRKWAGIDRFIDKSVDISLDHIHTVGLPQSVSVTGLGPVTRVRLQARLRTLALPVQPVTQGNPPPGYEVVPPVRANPPEIRVTGSYERLAEISAITTEIPTEPIVLEGRTSSFVAKPRLQAPAGVSLVNDEVAKNVSVAVTINEQEITKTIRDVPIQFIMFNEDLTAIVEPRVADIKLTGKVSAMEMVDADSFTFAWRGDLREELGQKGKVELLVDLNENLIREVREKVKIEDWSPKTIDIEFVRAPGAPPATDENN